MNQHEEKERVFDKEQQTMRRPLPRASFDHSTEPARPPQGGREVKARDKSHANPSWFKAAPG